MRFLITILIALALPLPAAAFITRNGMEAIQVNATDIAVAFTGGRIETDYWCAAGDVAQRAMGLPVSTRLWRASPKPRKAGEGIMFTIDPARATEGASLSQFGKGPKDGSISVGQATAAYCRIIIPMLNN